MKRRHFLYTSSIACLVPITAGLIGCSQTSSKSLDPKREVIVGGYSETDDQGNRLDAHGVIIIQPNGSTDFDIISDFSVPYEVHLATLFPDKKHVLVCSRKPEASLLKYSINGELQAELPSLNNQHFEGHGIFSIDEKYIYVTASDYHLKQGRLLKLNSQNLSLEKDYFSGGVGPHELVWQSDVQIAIANTGVLTHPDTERKALNLADMTSNISLFNSETESIDHQWHVPLQGLSARHLDRMEDGSLVIGCQYQKKDQRPACIAFADMNNGLVFAEEKNDFFYWNMKGYTASIKAVPNSNNAIITNPQGHLLTQWQMTKSTPLGSELIDKTKIEYNKGLKISLNGDSAWLSIGAGKLQHLDLINPTANNSVSSQIKSNIWWGNHLGS